MPLTFIIGVTILIFSLQFDKSKVSKSNMEVLYTSFKIGLWSFIWMGNYWELAIYVISSQIFPQIYILRYPSPVAYGSLIILFSHWIIMTSMAIRIFCPGIDQSDFPTEFRDKIKRQKSKSALDLLSNAFGSKTNVFE